MIIRTCFYTQYYEHICNQHLRASLAGFKAKRDYAQDAITLIVAIKKCLLRAEALLFSKTASDVTEALLLVTRAVNFHIEGSDKSLQKYVCLTSFCVCVD
jgi:hypothetical protein